MAKSAKKYWDSEEVIGEVFLGDKQKRVVSVVTKGDDSFVSISTHKFYKLKEEPEGAESWRPSSGVTIPTGTSEGQQVFNLVATMFSAPQEPVKFQDSLTSDASISTTAVKKRTRKVGAV